jgi:hypothetical protein
MHWAYFLDYYDIIGLFPGGGQDGARIVSTTAACPRTEPDSGPDLDGDLEKRGEQGTRKVVKEYPRIIVRYTYEDRHIPACIFRTGRVFRNDLY